MNHKQLVTGHRSKHYKSQFIFKLVDIMKVNFDQDDKNFPNLIRWTENGQNIQLLEISQIQKNVLPYYFRHSKFQSFIRQLHLYNFKQKKQFKSQLIFQHSTFKRGNQSQFTLIQRTKNKKEKLELIKELENNDVLKSIYESTSLSQQQKQILGTMYSYKLVVIQKERSLRQKLTELTECIKSNRNKKISEIQTIMEDEVKLELQSLKKFSKSIDIFLTETISDREKQYQNNQNKNQNLQQGSVDNGKELSGRLINGEGLQKNGQNQINTENSQEKPQTYQNTHYQHVQQNHGYLIQLSGSSIASTDNRMFDYQIYFQNPSLNIAPQQQNVKSHQNIAKQIPQQQQTFVPSARMNAQNPMGLSMQIFEYQKEPSLLFMPLPFYNRSGASEFFDWPNTKQQNNQQKQNQVKQQQKGYQSTNKRKLPLSRVRSSQCQISNKTVKTNDCERDGNLDEQESEISFMNDE